MPIRLVIFILVITSLLSGCVLSRIVDRGKVEQHPLTEQDRREALSSQKVSEALSMFHEGDFLDRDSAIQTLTEALQLNPDNFDARFYRGLAYVRTEQPVMAEDDLRRASKIKPSDAKTRYLLGYALWKSGKSREAVEWLTTAIEKNSSFSEAYTLRAIIRASLGDHQLAVADYDQAIGLSPGVFDPWFNLGVAQLDGQRYEDAYRAFSEALSIKPGSAEAFEGRAHALIGLERFEEASRDLHFALSIKPDNPDIRVLYAEALEKSGDTAGALRAYRQAEAQYRAAGQEEDAAAAGAKAARLTVHLKTS